MVTTEPGVAIKMVTKKRRLRKNLEDRSVRDIFQLLCFVSFTLGRFLPRSTRKILEQVVITTSVFAEAISTDLVVSGEVSSWLISYHTLDTLG